MVPGIAFDIDGVFKAGRYFFPNGLKALALCYEANIPFVFVSNGGGGLGEAEYLSGFKKKLYEAASEEDRIRYKDALEHINTESMILSYTPMGEDEIFKDKRILLIGDPREKVKEIARSYGWSRAEHVSDYCAKYPTVDPFAGNDKNIVSAVANPPAPPPAGPSRGDANGESVAHAHAHALEHMGGNDTDNFDTVVVMTDPHDWFEALQGAVDAVVSADPNCTEAMEFDITRNIPVHFSNPDIFWKAAHPQPRFGQGAFRLAFETLLRSRLNLLKAPPAIIDMVLRDSVVQWGKPSKPTLHCAERRLHHLHATTTGASASSDSPSSLSGIWMVGDNPASDMAFSAMGGWRGCLVKTGVYVDTDARCGASMVCENVSDAVAHIIATAQAENDA